MSIRKTEVWKCDLCEEEVEFPSLEFANSERWVAVEIEGKEYHFCWTCSAAIENAVEEQLD